MLLLSAYISKTSYISQLEALKLQISLLTTPLIERSKTGRPGNKKIS